MFCPALGSFEFYGSDSSWQLNSAWRYVNLAGSLANSRFVTIPPWKILHSDVDPFDPELPYLEDVIAVSLQSSSHGALRDRAESTSAAHHKRDWQTSLGVTRLNLHVQILT